MTTRRRTWLWVAAALAVIVAVSAVGAYLTTPRPGGRMDPNATGPEGAHALVTLLRHRGVEVVPAATVDDVALHARPDTLVLLAQTPRIAGSELMNRLADLPGDLLLVAPDALARQAPHGHTPTSPAATCARHNRPEQSTCAPLRPMLQTKAIHWTAAMTAPWCATATASGPSP